MLLQQNMTPIVMFPRFTTIAGIASFKTAALNVERYSDGWGTVWRGEILGGGLTPSFEITMQESEDQQTWFTCGGSAAAADPGQDEERSLDFSISTRWLRAKIVLSGDEPVVTCWMVGFLKPRGK